jgi:hypothetical protein
MPPLEDGSRKLIISTGVVQPLIYIETGDYICEKD